MVCVTFAIVYGDVVADVASEDGLVRGAVNEKGQYRLEKGKNLEVDTVTQALAEWFQTDRSVYGGLNALKIRRQLR